MKNDDSPHLFPLYNGILQAILKDTFKHTLE